MGGWITVFFNDVAFARYWELDKIVSDIIRGEPGMFGASRDGFNGNDVENFLKAMYLSESPNGLLVMGHNSLGLLHDSHIRNGVGVCGRNGIIFETREKHPLLKVTLPIFIFTSTVPNITIL